MDSIITEGNCQGARQDDVPGARSRVTDDSRKRSSAEGIDKMSLNFRKNTHDYLEFNFFQRFDNYQCVAFPDPCCKPI